MALVLSLSSCGHVEIKDQEFCGDKGSLGAKCFHTLTPATRTISQPEWDNYRFGQICEKAEVFADWKKILEEQCSLHDNCDYPETRAVLDFLGRVEKFQRLP